jgi:hypothetical protein
MDTTLDRCEARVPRLFVRRLAGSINDIWRRRHRRLQPHGFSAMRSEPSGAARFRSINRSKGHLSSLFRLPTQVPVFGLTRICFTAVRAWYVRFSHPLARVAASGGRRPARKIATRTSTARATATVAERFIVLLFACSRGHHQAPATPGLPQINSVAKQMKARMDEEFDAGYDFTYLFPGVRKVVQAAGRVIRGQTDRECFF